MKRRQIRYDVQGIDDKLRKIERRVCKLDSCSPRDYIKWEEHVEHCIGSFPHTSFRLGAIIEKKDSRLCGYVLGYSCDGKEKGYFMGISKEELREFLEPVDYHDQQLE